MLVTSRSLVEYRAMFALTEHDVAGPLLDCCAGAAGLVAEASAAGGRAVAADPVFAQGVERVAAAVRESLAGGQQLIDDHAGQFVWDWYGTRDRRDAMRAEAARLFLADLGHRPDRYIAAELPRLPFVDNAFDLALCSHLLFTWARRWDESWHRTALRELARVAHEARVFPLVRAGDGSPAPVPGFSGEFPSRRGVLGRDPPRRVRVPARRKRDADRPGLTTARRPNPTGGERATRSWQNSPGCTWSARDSLTRGHVRANGTR